MRQTLIQDGIQDRLPNLLGDGSSTYSIQASMLENFNRIGKCLAGDSTYGVVMSGLVPSIIGNSVQVSSGYGATVGGNVICLGASYQSSSATPFTPTANAVIQVYVNYVESTRAGSSVSPAQGGQSDNFSIPPSPRPIIKDQIGARGETDVDSIIVTYSVGATITVSPTILYVGTLQWGPVVATGPIFTRQNDLSRTIDYVSSPSNKVTFYDSSGVVSTSLVNDSLILLDTSGTNRLRTLSIFRYSPSTNVPRNNTGYDMVFNVQGLGAGGTFYPLFSTSYSVPESINSFTRYDFPINQIIPSAYTALAVTYTAVTYTNLFTTPTTGCGRVSAIIEKLN